MREKPFLILWWLTLFIAFLFSFSLPWFLWIPCQILIFAAWMIFGAGYIGNYIRP